MDNYQHRRHNKNLLLVHIILVSKYRKKIFINGFQCHIKQYIYDICKENHWYIKRMETDKDHIHILLQYNPTDNIANIISTIKQNSTYRAWIKDSELLKKYYWGRQILWSSGYFAASVGQVSQKTIDEYIKNQG